MSLNQHQPVVSHQVNNCPVKSLTSLIVNRRNFLAKRADEVEESEYVQISWNLHAQDCGELWKEIPYIILDGEVY